jgi:hypothetical protein
MGRPIGSMNREKPFNHALLMTLRSNPVALRRIAAKFWSKRPRKAISWTVSLRR